MNISDTHPLNPTPDDKTAETEAPSSPIIENEDVATGSPPPTPSLVADPSQTERRTVGEVIAAEIHKTTTLHHSDEGENAGDDA